MSSKVTTAIILEKRKQRKDKRFPIKLRITYKGVRKYYKIQNEQKDSIAYFKSEFAAIMEESPRGNNKKMKIYLSAIEGRAIEVINKLPRFTFEAFEKKFRDNVDDEDIFSAFKNVIKELNNEGRISTAVSYQGSLSSLKKYYPKPKLFFTDINVAFLKEYEKWMLDEENSLTTVGIYLRNVRTLFNRAINSGIITSEYYPFGKNNYQIPGGRNIKKALTLMEVGLIASYPTIDGTNEQRYRDYWLFSYLSNGINVKDIALLKRKNIEGDIITILRAKTREKHKKEPRIITIIITEQMTNIISKWSNAPISPNDYIFPILEKGLKPKQEYARIQQTTKMINKYIDRIAKKVGISQKVRTYNARHSFASVLKRSGASTEFISESLGHSNISTTQDYLADFEIEEKRKWAEKLGAFNNEQK